MSKLISPSRFTNEMLLAAAILGFLAVLTGCILYALGFLPPLLVKLIVSIGGTVTAAAGIISRRPVFDWVRSVVRHAEWRVVILIVVIVSLVAGATFGALLWTSRPLEHSLHAAVSATAPIYVADWSSWAVAGQWHVETSAQQVDQVAVKNVLLSDGSASCCDPAAIAVIAPTHAPSDNYAIEARIQIFGISTSARPGQVYFGLLMRADQYGDGDLAGILDNSPEPHPGITFLSAIGSGTAPEIMRPFPLDNLSHLLRAEIQGFTLRFYIDGKLMFQATSSTYLSSRGFGLVDSGYELKVSKLLISPLHAA